MIVLIHKGPNKILQNVSATTELVSGQNIFTAFSMWLTFACQE